MDQEQIGKFIAKMRKEKNLTQMELAEKLGVSDRTVGNWENSRNMPDLSLFKPLCEVLGITLNELISGEKLDSENKDTLTEDNIIKTINYSNQKIKEKNNNIGIILIIFGIILGFTSFSMFKSESSWGSIYSIVGLIISCIGVAKLTKKLKLKKRLTINILFFIIYFIMLVLVDFISVLNINQAPRFSFETVWQYNVIEYNSFFYKVFRLNHDTINEYYIIDLKNNYSIETVPNSPFNRTKSGIDNIIKYKNKYVGNNSNDGNLINNLPLGNIEHTFEIDSKNLGLIINYHMTDWYINDNLYLERSLIYNSVSLFSLINNLKYITYNFSGKTYQITRSIIENNYPNYMEINKDNIISKEKFNKYLESKMHDDLFVDEIFNKLFKESL